MENVSVNQKTKRLFEYISDLSKLRFKPIATLDQYEEVMFITDLPNEPECKSVFTSKVEDWLYVKRPQRLAKLHVPEGLEKWVTLDHDNYTIKVRDSVTKEVINDEGEVETKVTNLSDLPEINEKVNQFTANEWETYKTEGLRRKKIQETYDHLFDLYQQLKNNSETLELVISAGLLQWKTKKGKLVKRHVLSSETELTFNKESGIFTIMPSSKGLQFTYEEDMLEVEDQLSRKDLQDVQKQIEQLESIDQVEDCFDSALSMIAHGLDSQGSYQQTYKVPRIEGENPIVSLSPAFVLRKKGQKNFLSACETAIEQITELEEDQIPQNIANMVNNEVINEADSEGDQPFREQQEFYFPLASNEEQNRIISTLSHRNSVLVQGPPGTGKTHTIANLISHFLASGERILITSQTAKALDVLKAKLPAGLQNLTVSLLGGDSASMKDLEKVVDTISYNKENMNLSENKKVIANSKDELKELRSQLAKTKTELFELREKETYKHNFSKVYSGTASQIAEKVYTNRSEYNWYSSFVTNDTPDEHASDEQSLIKSYLELFHRDITIPEDYSTYIYPRLSDEFDSKTLLKMIVSEKQYAEEYKSLSEDQSASLEAISEQIPVHSHERILNHVDELEAKNSAILYHSFPNLQIIAEDIFKNRGYIWVEVNKKAKEYYQLILDNKELADVSLLGKGSLSTAVLYKMSEDLHEHVSSGGSIEGFLIKPKIVRDYKTQLKEVSYNGKPIKTDTELQFLVSAARVLYAKEKVKELLSPHFDSHLQDHSVTYVTELNHLIKQIDQVLELEELREEFFKLDTSIRKDELSYNRAIQLRHDIRRIQTKTETEKASEQIQHMIRLIRDAVSNQLNVHPVYEQLINSVETRNHNGVSQLIKEYVHYQEIVERDAVLSDLLKKLDRLSPALRKELEQNADLTMWEKRLQIWNKAFEWKKANHWVKEFSNRSEHVLSEKYDQIEQGIKNLLTNTGETKAWSHMIENMTDQQSKHLKAWAQQVRKIGKGTGKNAVKHRRIAQEHMEQCIDAIPAWIMPLYQVFDNFEVKPNLFDVVIIDEASQSWHDALLLKYLAKKMIIVGDNQQISPDIIGVLDEDIERLNRKHFTDIDFAFGKDLDRKASFFDIAYIMFKDTITLREHFRCMPEIIGFSNQISYQNKPLIPLRQYQADRLKPLQSIYLPHGVRYGSSSTAYNEEEANAIVETIAGCVNDPAYDGKTFGVISLLGNNQAKLIQNKLIETLGAEVMEDRKIISGDAYDFQGDERDVIFLSMVASATGQTRLTALTDMKARQRFNVAASRAKDQLWLVHSLTVNDISNRDCMRYQLLSYFANPLKEETESNREKCESEFERQVFDRITARGYQVIPQFEVAGYRLDLVVQGEKSRLVVECDGDYWHTSPEDQERDFLRERVLQRAGWHFWRVLGSTFYHDPEKALESLWNRLEDMEIYPFAEWGQQVATDDSEELVSEVTEDNNHDFSDSDYLDLEDFEDDEDDFSDFDDDEDLTDFKEVSEDEDDEEVAVTVEDDHVTELSEEGVMEENRDPEELLKDLKEAGYKVIDHRSLTETIWLVGGHELDSVIEEFAAQNIIFRFRENGHSVTNYEPTWFAKMKVKKK
ncbi:AAA domain-containing protein [Jeotgalibacillus sp. JSM ZJ347]|uniref:AAA domain-containing protein n=1 Tax=Jeotgalibacillus sp. JSM ZJ347 TaxID=3342117 RepID=UPI0035A88390